MTEPHQSNVSPAPHAQLIQMMGGMLTAQVLYVVAELGIADQLRDGPRSGAELAVALGTEPSATYRLLRSAAGLGLFAEQTDGFALTALGAALQSGAPGYARSTLRWLASPLAWRVLAELRYSVETGKPAWERVAGQSIGDYLSANPDASALVNEMMMGFHGDERAAVVAAYDFSPIKTLVDVGGGVGQLLATVLKSVPGMRGVLYELPHLMQQARQYLEGQGMLERCELTSGSFFEAIPEGADAYVLSHVIHDWSEEQCLSILRNCRRAVGKGSRLLLVEMVIPPGNDFHPAKMLDMQMLIYAGGRERTATEYGGLLHNAGFRLTRVIPTVSAVSIIEAVPD